jgi:broad specificity phosphatase PhoE
MRKVHLVRHGESIWNSIRRVQGNHEGVHLSELGRAQAKMLGKRLGRMEISRVYCSSADRAVETARIALGEDYPIEFVDDLCEISFGSWEGKLVSDIREQFPGVMEKWFHTPSKVKIEGAEDFGAFHLRVRAAIGRIIESTEGDILIVAHGGTICTWLTHILGMEPDDLWSFSLPNTSLTTVVLDFKPRIRLLGDVSHLDGRTLGFDGMPSPTER